MNQTHNNYNTINYLFCFINRIKWIVLICTLAGLIIGYCLFKLKKPIFTSSIKYTLDSPGSELMKSEYPKLYSSFLTPQSQINLANSICKQKCDDENFLNVYSFQISSGPDKRTYILNITSPEKLIEEDQLILLKKINQQIQYKNDYLKLYLDKLYVEDAEIYKHLINIKEYVINFQRQFNLLENKEYLLLIHQSQHVSDVDAFKITIAYLSSKKIINQAEKKNKILEFSRLTQAELADNKRKVAYDYVKLDMLPYYVSAGIMSLNVQIFQSKYIIAFLTFLGFCFSFILGFCVVFFKDMKDNAKSGDSYK